MTDDQSDGPPPPPVGPPPPPVAPQYGPPPAHPGPGTPRPGPVVGAVAEWWRRLVAVIIDGLILSIPNALISFLLGIETTSVNEATDEVTIDLGALGAVTLIALVVSVIYSGILEGSNHGQTIGKMAMRIQVRDADTGGPIGFGRAAKRRLIYQALFLPLAIPGLINGLSPLWDSRRQAWHDKAANTLVVNSS